MIHRMNVRCRGCDEIFTLRLGMNVSKRAAFYFLCPACGLPIQGELSGNSIENVRLEIGGDATSEAPGGRVTTADPNAPVLVTADSLKGDIWGGMTTMTLNYLCGERVLDYVTMCSRGIQFLEDDWPAVERSIRYYMNSDVARFESAAKKTRLVLPKIGFATTHERASQLYNLVGIASVGIMEPSPTGTQFIRRLSMKHTAALRHDSYRRYARDLLASGRLLETERRQLEEVLLFIDHAEAWRIGMLPRYMRPDIDLEQLGWRVLRNEFSTLRDLYIHGFETVCRSLGPLVAAQNTIKRTNPDDFGDESPEGRPNAKLSPPVSMARYEGLVNADKLCFVRAIPGISNIANLLDGRLRNAIGHSSARHDLLSGRIVADKLPDGLAYLDFVAKVADVFEALTLVTQVTRFMRVASSPDFPADAEASADGTLR